MREMRLGISKLTFARSNALAKHFRFDERAGFIVNPHFGAGELREESDHSFCAIATALFLCIAQRLLKLVACQLPHVAGHFAQFVNRHLLFARHLEPQIEQLVLLQLQSPPIVKTVECYQKSDHREPDTDPDCPDKVGKLLADQLSSSEQFRVVEASIR